MTSTGRRFDLVELDRFRYDTPAQIIPAIPPGPVSSGGSGAGKRKRGRNTVFDDRGPATGTGT